MQAPTPAPGRSRVRRLHEAGSAAHPGAPGRTVAAGPFPSVTVTGALRAVEALLLGAGQRTARRNAWTSVLEDRRRAADRVAAQHVLEAASDRTPRAT
ncbi:hypothetical protein [Streptomyces sp. ODS05-4]|uniref:SCO2195 family GlnR-regulated protein n=1 Tax=Streptomyces sp. ODS05-4 TaxID=2944939 RepID=UPI00210C34E7|nr:hypothetical protein [Streptomyces sp. ODS05-4]